MVGAICVGGSAVVTESSIFVSSVLSISIPAGCNNLGLVFGDGVVVDSVELVTVDVVDACDVVEAVEVVVCVSVFSMVLGSDSVVSSVVVSVVVEASVVVGSSVDVVVITVVGLVIGSVDVTDFVDVASRSFCSIISESISKYVSGLNSNPNISIRSSN